MLLIFIITCCLISLILFRVEIHIGTYNRHTVIWGDTIGSINEEPILFSEQYMNVNECSYLHQLIFVFSTRAPDTKEDMKCEFKKECSCDIS